MKSNKRQRLTKNILYILALIFIAPLGIFLVLRGTWTKRNKIIASILGVMWVILLVFGYFNAPPSVTLSNLKESGNVSVQGSDFRVEGSVYPTSAVLKINDNSVMVDSDGSFSYVVQLEEGDNDIRITVKKDDKIVTNTYLIHRMTKQEISDKKAEEERKKQAKADAEKEAAGKKEADAKAAAAKELEEKQATDAAAAEADAAAAKAKADAAVTVSQKNALNKAKSYMSYTAFSHDGLVDQLMYEQFSAADATYGADNVGANWNEQAAKKAKSYMSYSSFSRGSLIDQLKYDKFTPEQAAYGATAIGL